MAKKDIIMLLLVVLSCVGFIFLAKTDEPYSIETQTQVIEKGKIATKKAQQKIKKIKQKIKKSKNTQK